MIVRGNKHHSGGLLNRPPNYSVPYICTGYNFLGHDIASSTQELLSAIWIFPAALQGLYPV